jgi:farnesyl-diphosphate farnesyltransferase
MALAANELLSSLLRDVSRSFYKTLQVLPGAIRRQIGLAYLLARTTDTIADTEVIPAEHRLDALDRLRRRILGSSDAPVDFKDLAAHQGSPAERILLENCEGSLELLNTFTASDRLLIREVIAIIASGQELDIRRFATRAAAEVVALQNEAEMEDYTYRVAGCVGEFWTRICRAHLFPRAPMDDRVLLENGVRFGKGLQLVNILRDLPADLKNGRCYLPADLLAQLGLRPPDLRDAANEAKVRPLYDRYLAQAESHLAAGWEYTHLIPRGQVRVRLACAWPILIGAKTITRLRTGRVLDPDNRIKISRSEVRGILWQTVIRYPWAGMWRALLPGPASSR